MEHKLRQAYERQLDRKHLPEGPVVGGVGECVESPFLQHAARHHVPLHFLQDVPEDLVADRRREQRFEWGRLKAGRALFVSLSTECYSIITLLPD